MPVRLEPEQFERLVEQAIAALPAWIAEHMENVSIAVAMRPSSEQRRASRLSADHMLLGLYEGVPLTRRGGGYHLHTPDRITLFQGPLQLVARERGPPRRSHPAHDHPRDRPSLWVLGG
jgi:predicted Zn-dependent protease with MMP-like domain